MAKNNRKKILFNRFSNQLHLLQKNGIIDIDLKYDKTYICPLCLNQFSENDIETNKNKNYLTEEDAPPASLGGSRIALTCKKCNSECGHKIDYQLKEFLSYDEERKFIEGSEQIGLVDYNGKPITAKVISKGNGKLIVEHNEKQNNPKYFKNFIETTKKGNEITFKPKPSRIDAKKITYAFLKTNYIITFSKFGYIFLLDTKYDAIRKQILNPEQEIVKYNLSVPSEHLKNNLGTYYVLDNKIRSILNVFTLKTDLTSKTYSAFLPIPKISFDSFVVEMGKIIKGNRAFFDKSDYDTNADLFADIEEIQKIINWINY